MTEQKKRFWHAAVMTVFVLGSTVGGTAVPPPEINIQGTLETPEGDPLIGPHEFRVRFFDVQDGGSVIATVSGTTSISGAGRFSLAVPFEVAVDRRLERLDVPDAGARIEVVQQHGAGAVGGKRQQERRDEADERCGADAAQSVELQDLLRPSWLP